MKKLRHFGLLGGVILCCGVLMNFTIVAESEENISTPDMSVQESLTKNSNSELLESSVNYSKSDTSKSTSEYGNEGSTTSVSDKETEKPVGFEEIDVEDAVTSTYDVSEKVRPTTVAAGYTMDDIRGEYTFKKSTPIYDNPISKNIIAYFDKGDKVLYDKKGEVQGVTFVSYVTKKGERLYVSIADYDISNPQINNDSSIAPNFNDFKDPGQVNYVAHIQHEGWQGWAKQSQTSGTTGKSLNLDAIKIRLHPSSYSYKGSIEYRTHIQNRGWQKWVKDGELSGTVSENLRMEAIQINLTGDLSSKYDVQYRTYVQNIGWQPWVNNGNIAGTTGKSLRIEAIQVKVVYREDARKENPWEIINKKGVYTFTKRSEIKNNPSNSGKTIDFYDKGQQVEYDGVLKNEGKFWLTYVASNGQRRFVECDQNLVDTQDSKRNPQVEPKYDKKKSGMINYLTHVQNVGWQDWVRDGQTAGTNGRSLRMEAFKLELGQLPLNGSVQYRAHVQNIGWQKWSGPGNYAGTSGRSLRMEALEIKLTGDLSKRYDIEYRAHVQNVGWMPWVRNGQMAGTQGRSLRMEALQIRLVER
ncbi:SH3 domain-containing protein [Floricoccus penangensis]|nr:SH3 domain-containing protein [Floricoccus penangensis]